MSRYEYLIYTPISIKAHIDILLVLDCDFYFYIQDNRYKTLLSIPKSEIAFIFEALFRGIFAAPFSLLESPNIQRESRNEITN